VCSVEVVKGGKMKYKNFNTEMQSFDIFSKEEISKLLHGQMSTIDIFIKIDSLKSIFSLFTDLEKLIYMVNNDKVWGKNETQTTNTKERIATSTRMD